MDIVGEVRSFNRFYTRKIGLLNEHLPASALSLAEARVLYELAQDVERAAADITRVLGMDKAHVSRIVARFRARGLVRSQASPAHWRRQVLALTSEGRAAFAALDQGTRAQLETVLRPANGARGRRLISAMREIRAVLGPDETVSAEVRLRPPAVGDFGWITHRQAVLFHEEYGWDWRFEALVAKIVGEFVAGFDVARDHCWIAERGGVIAGSIFLTRGDHPAVGRLRLLYVEPAARGLGIGGKLVAACVERARTLGYRNLSLWTNDVLVSARRIYQAAGFRMVAEERHSLFGPEVVGQTWELDLPAG